MQETPVPSLVQEDPIRQVAIETVFWTPHATTTEALCPRAHAPQQEKIPKGEDHVPQRRVASLPVTRENPTQQQRLSIAKIKLNKTGDQDSRALKLQLAVEQLLTGHWNAPKKDTPCVTMKTQHSHK